MAGLYCAKMTGIGQKIDTSLLGGQIRLMGWTMTTTMWKAENPVTGQARIMGTAERPAISASFNDKHGKPFVFQMGGTDWKQALSALGFLAEMQEKGFDDLGVAVTSVAQREAMLQTLNALFATGSRDTWVEILRQVDIVSAPINTLLEASNDPDVLANGYITEVEYPQYGKKVKVHGSPWQFSETPAHIGIAPELGEHNVPILTRLGYNEAQIQELKEKNII
jgi:crotonobetainyl-CoA:carnitine CoA-transferase CaiB-like acyl-CoA transferase